MKEKELKINVTFSLDPELVRWLEEKVSRDPEGTKSSIARKLFREAKAAEETEKGRK